MSKQDVFTLLGNTAAGEGTCTLPCDSNTQPLHPRDAAPRRGAVKPRTWGIVVCGAGEQPPMQRLPPCQSPPQQPGEVSLVCKGYIFIASHPVQKPIWQTAASSHMEERAAQSQLSARPLLRASILDFTVSLHSLKIIDINARLIKQ